MLTVPYFFPPWAILVFPICSLLVLLNIRQRTGIGRSASVKGKLFFVNMRVCTDRELGVCRDEFSDCVVLRSQEEMGCFDCWLFRCADFSEYKRSNAGKNTSVVGGGGFFSFSCFCHLWRVVSVPEDKGWCLQNFRVLVRRINGTQSFFCCFFYFWWALWASGSAYSLRSIDVCLFSTVLFLAEWFL